MKTYTLSLTRWHKVAERLARAYTEITKEAHLALADTAVSGYLGDTQVQRLREQAEEQLAALRRAFRLQDALVDVRRAIGEANVRTGINAELARQDALSRRQRFLEKLLAAQTSRMVALEELKQLPQPSAHREVFALDILQVRTLDAAAEVELRREAEELRGRVYSLADKVNDLNRERLTLELPEEAAQAASL